MKITEKLGFGKKKERQLLHIDIDCLVPNPMQPRQIFDEAELKRLAESVKTSGVLQPLCVKRRENIPSININGVGVTAKAVYEIIAGERRWRAARLAGLCTVPCIVMDATSGESAKLALTENIFRSDLGYFEQAVAMQNIMLVCGITQNELAASLSLSQPTVANKLRLLKLSEEERRIINDCKLPERVARAFLRVTNEKARFRLIKSAEAHGYTAEQCLHRIDAYLNGTPRPIKAKSTRKKGATQRIVGTISDMRFFMNTVEKAINLAGNAGYTVEKTENDLGDFIELKLIIPKGRKSG